jgi:hypothetical protein
MLIEMRPVSGFLKAGALAESQASDATIMSLAGHLSRKMMERYSHTRNEAKRQAIAALDRNAADAN